ncbi:MAG: hypothetical protein ACR2MS_02795 [Weeksellaceae bacterium]
MNTSCRKDLEFEPSGNTAFHFSQDTVFLDTVFTKSNSETFLVKVFNKTSTDYLISKLYLNQKDKSPFRINVDGRTGYEFNEVALRANDSLMIFVEIALGDNNNDWLAEDEIMVGNKQQIKLLAAVESAIYHYPSKDQEASEITNNTVWTQDKAHIIYGTLQIKENKKLEIEAGTRIYMHQNSRLIVEKNAALIANGLNDKKIIFRSDRQTTRYDTLPKQWNEIKLLPGSKFEGHNVQIKGANNGLNLDHAMANLRNVEIYNAGSSGIFSNHSEITGRNVVISDAGNASLNIENGGKYTFYFSSFANEGKSGVVGASGPNIPLYLSDYTAIEGQEITSPLHATFINSIFYGRYPNGAILDFKNKNQAAYIFESCVIKNEDKNTLDYATDSNFKNIITADPLFTSTIYSDQNLRLKPESPAKLKGNPLYINESPFDLDGIKRNNKPSIGAYN